MGWDEYLFGRLVDSWKNLRGPSESPYVAVLEDCRGRWAQLGASLLGHKLDIVDDSPDSQCCRDRIPLPRTIALFKNRQENELVYLLRILLHYAAIRSGQFGKTNERPQNTRRRWVIQSRHSLQFLSQDLPKFDEHLSNFVERLEKHGLGVLKRSFFGDLDAFLHLPNEHRTILPELPLDSWVVLPLASDLAPSATRKTGNMGSTLRAKTATKPRVIKKTPRQDNPLNHVFEKVLTADNYQGGQKNLDGSDQSEEHAEAVNELTLDTVIRTSKDVETFLKSDAEIETQVQVEHPTDIGNSTLYPEWFHRTKSYREDWVAVHAYHHPRISGTNPCLLTPQDRRMVKDLQHYLSSLFNHRIWQPRQADGSELDLDAIVRWASDSAADGPTEQRIYQQRAPLERRTSALILLDSSLSTDSWVNNNRVMDSLLKTIDILSRVLKPFASQYALATFHSFSRTNCRFGWIKDFDEPFSFVSQRLQAVKPEGYTRIGGAIRHATTQLLNRPHQRSLIFLGDGKPTDFDHYEGLHGTRDVQMAIREAVRSEIHFQSILFAERANKSMMEAFEQSPCEVIQGPSEALFGVLREFLKTTLRRRRG